MPQINLALFLVFLCDIIVEFDVSEEKCEKKKNIRNNFFRIIFIETIHV